MCWRALIELLIKAWKSQRATALHYKTWQRPKRCLLWVRIPHWASCLSPAPLIRYFTGHHVWCCNCASVHCQTISHWSESRGIFIFSVTEWRNCYIYLTKSYRFLLSTQVVFILLSCKHYKQTEGTHRYATCVKLVYLKVTECWGIGRSFSSELS